MSKAKRTCTIIRLRSLEDLGGGFDIPKSKCPPGGGSSDCVTGSPALKHATACNHSFYSSSPLSSSPLSSKDPRQNIVYPPTPPTSIADVASFPPSSVEPQPIRAAPRAMNFSHGLATPPLTPDDFLEDVSVKSNDDALELLTALFPNHALSALPYAKSVSISSPEMETSFDGVVLELARQAQNLLC